MKTKKNRPKAIGRYVIISAPESDNPLVEVTGVIEGTFDTRDQVDSFIRRSCEEHFELSGAVEGRNEHWDCAMFICKVVAVRKAIPIVSVRVEVTDAAPAHSPAVDGRPKGDKP